MRRVHRPHHTAQTGVPTQRPNVPGSGRSQLVPELTTGGRGMLKLLGGTAGIIFIIGLIVVIGLFKLVF